MADKNSLRNPLGPLIGKKNELLNAPSNLAAAAQEYGGRSIDTATSLGKSAARLALGIAKKPVDVATDVVEDSFGLASSAVKELGKMASGLLPALGDRESKQEKE